MKTIDTELVNKSDGTAPALYRGYVRTSNGEFYVQIPDDTFYGFTLYSDDQSWPGGLGLAASWQAVGKAEVPRKVRLCLDALLGDL